MLYIKDNEVREQRDITIELTGRYTAFGEEVTHTCTVTNPTHTQLLSAGWTPYLSERESAVERYVTATLAKSVSVSNPEALDYLPLLQPWEKTVGGSLKQGQIVSYGGSPWRARQDILSVLENQAPGIDTAALYERTDREHNGTREDPIPYEPPMEIFSGKYYTQADVLYLCIRDSGTALTHDLAELMGDYVQTAE